MGMRYKLKRLLCLSARAVWLRIIIFFVHENNLNALIILNGELEIMEKELDALFPENNK